MEALRIIFLGCAVGGFAGLGLTDLFNGRYATGLASMCLATANILLLR